ncbi:MAG: phosphatidate cytidylyltransferase [Mucilaginibacter sp.]
MNNFARRTLTGAGLVILIVTAIWVGPYSFTGLILLINMLSLMEFYHLLEIPGNRPSKRAGAILSSAFVICCMMVSASPRSWRLLLLLIPAMYGIFIAVLYGPAKKPFPDLAITFLGLICISLPACFFVALPFLWPPAGSYRFEVPFAVFLLLWTNDTTAYLFGSRFGKHKLFLKISPGKTWEGSFAGAAASLGMAYILSLCFPVLNLVEWEGLTLIIVVTGTYGDLVKSLLKRSTGVKDSGTILPGHGGMLDRFDSWFGSAPFAFIYLTLLKS